MSGPMVMLVDNGSSRAAATLGLRRLAARLSVVCDREVHAVSLQHANRIPREQLGGVPALVLEEFLRARLVEGRREFVMLPLFFGMSRALTGFVPDLLSSLREEFGEFDFRLGDVLSPLPRGEPLLADILADNVRRACADIGHQADRVILVDHGSPVREVSAVRTRLAELLAERLAPGIRLEQAVMERRSGQAYDFNGQLLEQALQAAVPGGGIQTVVLAMLFISPGRHAGPDGDIEAICANASAREPGLRLAVSPLIGDHPLLIEILRQRLLKVLGDSAVQSVF